LPSILNGFAQVRPNPRQHRCRFYHRGQGDSRKADAMTTDRIDRTGFAPHGEERVRGRYCNILAQLIATVALVMSIAVTATVVTFGIARADAPGAGAEDMSARLAVALLFGFVLVGMGGLTAFLSRSRLKQRD